ncbi:ligand-binding sensor domain-containing protein [Acidicapsa ligni]|uniref:ligand-binding sensor domain-containing protein n=1 Tax=Acidicapsa ligni TaxID=542300 RepID=UPI0021DFAA98|nr:sensor histidine kinase [Acidicapsa ligni]
MAQYVHAVWGADKGYAGGTVYAIAQTPDGYLWLGTEHGLVRFDGSEFTPIDLPLSDRRSVAVRGLVEDAYGDLWIRLDGPRLLRYRNGAFEDAVLKFDIHEGFFAAMSRDRSGKLLLWGPQNRTLRFQNGHFQRESPQDDIDGIVISLLDSPTGALWLGARDAGLYKIENGKVAKILPELLLHSVNALVPSEHEGVWIGAESGLYLWEHGISVRLKLPERLGKVQIFALLRDHHHNLWAGTDAGLYRIDPERNVVTGFFRSQDDPEITSIYEDGDGSIWFAGSHGLERLRDGMFTSISSRDPSLSEIGGPVFVDDAGRAWFGPSSGGLFCLENGSFKRVDIPGDNNDVVYSIDGAKDELWLGRQRGGLTELIRRGDGWSSRTYTSRQGLAQNSVYTVTRARDKSIWAGTVSGGMSVLRNGQFTTYTLNNGLPSNAIFSSVEAADGTMWVASSGGLAHFTGEHWLKYGSPQTDLPPGIRTVFEDSSHVLWIGTSHGIARFNNGRIDVPPGLPQALSEEVLSIGEDAQGFLWVSTSGHVLQVDRTKMLNGTLNENDVLSYGVDDGLSETKGVRRDRSLVSDSSGRIWLSLPHSLAVADPREAEGYNKAVRVRIESVSADTASLGPQQGLNLSPDTRSITFRYAGTSLATPQRTQFRYRLDGLDQEWSNDSSSRQVVYTHLSPSTYTFRIMASNALGAWNGPENDVKFTVQPALWQTWYFQMLAVLLTAVVAIGLYRIRLKQVTGQLNRRFQDRLAERTRIAQELHDTLLQGVISASMQLDVAQDDIAEDSPARPKLQRLLHQMRQVTTEGRRALQGLRTIDNTVTAEAAFQRMMTEFTSSPSSRHAVYVQGDNRPLKTVVFDEVYRIGHEAYLNAVVHASAREIEITVDYGLRVFRLLVRDDGCGIDPGILRHGREGHWGLAGMRERAEAIGSDLAIHTRPSGGTEVELRIPAAIAYSRIKSRRIQWPWPLRKFYPKHEKRDEQSQ